MSEHTNIKLIFEKDGHAGVKLEEDFVDVKSYQEQREVRSLLRNQLEQEGIEIFINDQSYRLQIKKEKPRQLLERQPDTITNFLFIYDEDGEEAGYIDFDIIDRTVLFMWYKQTHEKFRKKGLMPVMQRILYQFGKDLKLKTVQQYIDPDNSNSFRSNQLTTDLFENKQYLTTMIYDPIPKKELVTIDLTRTQN